MIQLKISNHPLDEIPGQLALVTAFEDVRPLKGRAGLVDWRLNGRLSKFIRDSKFQGTKGEALLMPTRGRIDSSELLLLGVGPKTTIRDSEIPHLLTLIVEKVLHKNAPPFRFPSPTSSPACSNGAMPFALFVSMISGREEDLSVTLVEDGAFVEDAKKRHMDFAYDVSVHYDLM